MTPEERNLISGLFDRLGQASSQAKDAEADQLIRSKVAEIPAAPYMLVQSLLVMQQAVANAQSRISALEKQVAEREAAPSSQPAGGSFLAGVASLFGGGQAHATTTTRDNASAAASGSDATGATYATLRLPTTSGATGGQGRRISTRCFNHRSRSGRRSIALSRDRRPARP